MGAVDACLILKFTVSKTVSESVTPRDAFVMESRKGDAGSQGLAIHGPRFESDRLGCPLFYNNCLERILHGGEASELHVCFRV